MRATAKVTSKGQVTIPVDIRKQLGITAGDSLVFEVRAGYATVVRQRSAIDVGREQLEKRGESAARCSTKEEAIAAYFAERGRDEDDPERYADECFIIGGKGQAE